MQHAPIESTLALLKPLRAQIHSGMYPGEILRKLGENGFYSAFMRGGISGLAEMTMNIAKVSKVCGNTGFCVWAQASLIWYLLNSCNPQPSQKELFAKLSNGEILGGTGLSNPLKAFAGLEKIRLKARYVENGIIINGTLSWVSNLQVGHYFAVIAQIEDSTFCAQNCVFALIHCNEALKLKPTPPFSAYEGSGTFATIFKDYFVSEENILSNAASDILPKITAGFVLMQCGMGLGLGECAIKEIAKSYLQKEYLQSLQSRLQSLREQILYLADKIHDTDALDSVLRVKFDLIPLVNELANLCVMHCGANGYLHGAAASKLLIESAFFSIVSPSNGHIQKLLN